jgi:formate hydrogenlyase subunit 6/NADH:ubiquinone oxidoreductase subunit I
VKLRRQGVREAVRTLRARPSTVRYPKERLAPPEGFRGRVAVAEETCIGCTKCAVVCPTACISMVEGAREVPLAGGRAVKRLRRPEVHLFDCIRCGLCEDVCPTQPKSIFLTARFAGASLSHDEVVR